MNGDRPSDQPDNSSEPLIVAGAGWGKVALSVDRKTVESVLGEGQSGSQFDKVYFINYPSKGIEISYNRNNDTLRAVFFYNGQRQYESFATFQGRTDKGVDWKSSPNDAIRAYGNPKQDYKGDRWRRIAFHGIDFRWENGALVRIGIYPEIEPFMGGASFLPLLAKRGEGRGEEP